MQGELRQVGWAGLLLVVIGSGCSTPKTTEAPAAGDDASVRERFAELQAALKSSDVDKLWMLLADKSRADAERIAKGIQQAYAEAGPQAKAEQETALGLTGTELAGLTGKGVLKNERFRKKFHEVPDSKIVKVEVHGDSATLYYLEPDDEEEKIIFLRQKGQWKAWLTVPGLRQPGS
jgi:hypothetical protein